jgi:hypothetical protein
MENSYMLEQTGKRPQNLGGFPGSGASAGAGGFDAVGIRHEGSLNPQYCHKLLA